MDRPAAGDDAGGPAGGGPPAAWRGCDCRTPRPTGWTSCPAGWSTQWTYNPGSRFKHASPTLADVDNDGYQETLIGNWNGWLYCFDIHGNVKWAFQTGNVIHGAPLAVDCDGNGTKEIFIGSEDGYVYGLDCNGNQLTGWGWPQLRRDRLRLFRRLLLPLRGRPGRRRRYRDSGGQLGALHLRLALRGRRTSPAGPTTTPTPSGPRPACGDIDLDGQGRGGHRGRLLERAAPGPGPRGGLVYCFEGNGSIKADWPKSVPQVVWSSPAIADLNLDGFPDVVVGTGMYWQDTNPGETSTYLSYADGTHVYAWDYQGNDLPGWPVQTGDNVFASPAIADIDEDGFFEVACGSNDGWLYVWEHNGSVEVGPADSDAGKMASPIHRRHRR